MTSLWVLNDALRRPKFAESGQPVRTSIRAVEHETVPLPQAMVKSDGSLDVYEDVLPFFRPTYQNNRPSIQCGRWVGYIP